MNKTILLISLICPASIVWAAPATPEDFGIELQNKVTTEVLVTIQNFPGGKLQYEYEVKNSSLSLQSIINFAVQVNAPASKADMVAAPTWLVGGCCGADGELSTADWIAGPNDPFIRPGASLRGFKLIVSSLPGIKPFYAQGFTTKNMAEGEFSEEEMATLAKVQDYFTTNSFSGKTLGPDPVPEVINLAELIDRLISLKHQAMPLGWFLGSGADGIIKSLDAKLEAAKVSINRGQNKTAANQLNAFIRELTALRGKKLNDNAYFLLKTNAEFIVSKVEP